jgi:hypothetical protein
MYMVFIDKCRYEIQEQKFRYGITVHTGPFRALHKDMKQYSVGNGVGFSGMILIRSHLVTTY